MAESNPLGRVVGEGETIVSPATNSSLKGPWAFLVQDAETGKPDVIVIYLESNSQGRSVALSFAFFFFRDFCSN